MAIRSDSDLVQRLRMQLTWAVERSGLTRAAVARRLGVSPVYVTQVLNDGYNMTVEQLERIAEAFGCTVLIRLVHKRL